mmetsp:Transcript_27300/g.78447  ORF Transcript_27300/g.78447 Transcript_27300/m.78447 type:complete len:215 (+) Transcript_27300:180-824(+)
MWPMVEVTRTVHSRSTPSAHTCGAANSKRGMAREMPRTFRGPERRLGGESAFASASAMLGFSATMRIFRSPSSFTASREVGPDSAAATVSGEKRPRYSKYSLWERICCSGRMTCVSGSPPKSSPPRPFRRLCSSRRSSGEGGAGGAQGSGAASASFSASSSMEESNSTSLSSRRFSSSTLSSFSKESADVNASSSSVSSSLPSLLPLSSGADSR